MADSPHPHSTEGPAEAASPGRHGMTRRRALGAITIVSGAVIAIVVGIQSLRYLISPIFGVPGKKRWQTVGSVAGMKPGEVRKLSFVMDQSAAYMTEKVNRYVWVINDAPEGSSKLDLVVYSPICPHAGCYYNYNEGKNQFHCPCHQSSFAVEGVVIGGPAPRPLDQLPYMVDDQGSLSVEWKVFQAGEPKQILISY
ncbi:MAG: hypothetical protein COS95_01970 [Ignavibacteriales bacterium CG07_land_8_20_14_0_80_59_12]|nr:MAG: hypothetical protein COS95_01970 [Ignavibacteriales bacterium CG07_land_8_20_14_0_80_59_12]